MKTDPTCVCIPSERGGFEHQQPPHERSPPANCGYKTGIVREFYLLESDNSSPPHTHTSPPQLPAAPRLLAPTATTRISHPWLLLVFLPKAQRQGGICVGLCLKGREEKHSAGLWRPRIKSLRPGGGARNRRSRRDDHDKLYELCGHESNFACRR